MKIPRMVGFCPFCGQGLINIVKDTATLVLHLSCDECETEWAEPNKLEEEDCLPYNTYRRHEFPTDKEIVDAGWSKFIITP